MSIKRYDMEKEYSLDINVLPVEEHDGSFVRYEDHAAEVARLNEQVRALAAECHSAKSILIKIHAESFDSDHEFGKSVYEKDTNF